MARELNPSPCYFVISDYLPTVLPLVVVALAVGILGFASDSPVVELDFAVGMPVGLQLAVQHIDLVVDTPVVVVLAAALHIAPVVGMLAAFHNLVVVAGILVVPVLLDLCPANQSALPYQP